MTPVPGDTITISEVMRNSRDMGLPSALRQALHPHGEERSELRVSNHEGPTVAAPSFETRARKAGVRSRVLRCALLRMRADYFPLYKISINLPCTSATDIGAGICLNST